MQNERKTTKTNYLKSVIQLIIFLSIGVFFIWLSLRGMTADDYGKIKEVIVSINNPKSWFFIICSMLTGAVAHYVRALRNIEMIRPLGYEVRKSMGFFSVMVCYFANLGLPRAGEVLRCVFLQKYERVPFQKSLGTVVTERAFDIVCWLVLLIVVIVLNTALLSQVVMDEQTGITLGETLQLKISSMLINYKIYIILGVLAILGVIVYKTRAQWGKISFFVKIRNFFVGIWQGLVSIKDLKKPWLFVFYTVLMWFLYFFGTYVCFFAFDFLRDLGPAPAFTVLVLSTVAFMVAQGGLGAYPWMVAQVLLLYGVAKEAGLAAGWIGWLGQTVMIIVFGIASLIIASFMKEQNLDEHSGLEEEIVEK
ncbi:MAG: flippase-like domain-containing protein [Bacteroidales bacterium]|nr:flippase-like domain-containing protein [Bacteroidales bacterium]